MFLQPWLAHKNTGLQRRPPDGWINLATHNGMKLHVVVENFVLYRNLCSFEIMKHKQQATHPPHPRAFSPSPSRWSARTSAAGVPVELTGVYCVCVGGGRPVSFNIPTGYCRTKTKQNKEPPQNNRGANLFTSELQHQPNSYKPDLCVSVCASACDLLSLAPSLWPWEGAVMPPPHKFVRFRRKYQSCPSRVFGTVETNLQNRRWCGNGCEATINNSIGAHRCCNSAANPDLSNNKPVLYCFVPCKLNSSYVLSVCLFRKHYISEVVSTWNWWACFLFGCCQVPQLITEKHVEAVQKVAIFSLTQNKHAPPHGHSDKTAMTVGTFLHSL